MHPRKSQRRPHTRKPEANPKLTKLSPKESHRRFMARPRTKAKHDSDEPDGDYESEGYTTATTGATDFVLGNKPTT